MALPCRENRSDKTLRMALPCRVRMPRKSQQNPGPNKKKPEDGSSGFSVISCDRLLLGNLLVAVLCVLAELFLDAEKLVVLSHTVGAA